MRSGLVSVAWLAKRMATKPGSVKILDATWFLPNSPFAAPAGIECGRDAYDAGPRLAGAAFWDLDAVSDADATVDTPHNVPTAAQFAAACAAAGISSADDEVVVYDGVGTFSAPRLWYTLRSFGLTEVAVLDGGLPAWIAAGQPVETGPPRPAAPAAEADWALDSDARWLLPDVKDWLAADAAARRQLVDARPAGRFEGDAPEPRPGARSGHAPGSKNAPFLSFLDQNPATNADADAPGGPFRGATLKAPDELRARFVECGVDLDRPLALTCGSGLTAAVVKLALHAVNVEDGPIYDGAWCEYEGVGDACPVATGPAEY